MNQTHLSDIKNEFPIFQHQPELVYLDSAATALKPASVIAGETAYLTRYSANIARGLYPLAEQATEEFEKVRGKIARFIGAHEKEIIFTQGTTDSINLTARLVEHALVEGENIVTTEIEHHSNYLPWKELATRTRLELRIAPLLPDGKIDRARLEEMIDAKTRLVAFSAVSNVLGTIQPVTDLIRAIKKQNSQTLVLIDAAQAIGHDAIDVKAWGADFVAFSGHKMFGPTGVGILYGASKVLEKFPPVSFGGGMVLDACASHTLYKESPYRFEAGTPHIGGVIGLGAAVAFIEDIGVANIRSHEQALSAYAYDQLQAAFGEDIHIFGPRKTEERGGVLAFTLDGGSLHPHDIAHILGERNICIRAGEHCAAPLHRFLDVPATARISFSLYNNTSDIDRLIEGLKVVRSMLRSKAN